MSLIVKKETVAYGVFRDSWMGAKLDVKWAVLSGMFVVRMHKV